MYSAELEVVDSIEHPWPSIGRVNFAGYRTKSMCTGTLIAPNLVLTAAHCLFNKRTSKRLPVKDLRFMAGVRRDQYAARLEAACTLVPKSYDPQNHPKIGDLHKDVGLIVLKEKSRLAPLPVLSMKEAPRMNADTQFEGIGYRRSRRYLPTRVSKCTVLAAQDEVWIANCPTESGASGGPFLLRTPNGIRVAAITVSKIDDDRSVVVPFPVWQKFVSTAACQVEPEKRNAKE